MVNDATIKDRIVDGLIYIAVTLCALVCLLPILNTLALSFSSSTMAMAGKVTFWPMQFTTQAYRRVVEDRQFYVSFMNSVKRVLLGGGINFVMMVLAAFPLSHSKRHFRGRNVYMWILVFNMLFSGGLVPTYMVVSGLGLIDTIWALVLPGAVPVWNCILLMNFFKNLPEELEEAAVIDGAQPYQILLRVYLPVSLPSLATVMLFSIVGHWNEFFSGMIYMNSIRNYPMATYISTMVNAAKDLSTITDPIELQRALETSDTTINSAKIFVSMVPILVLYPFMQRYFVTGLVVGSVKE